VRRQERTIMQICVRGAGVPRDVFRKAYVGSETSVAWVNRLIQAKKNFSNALDEQKDEIFRCQK